MEVREEGNVEASGARTPALNRQAIFDLLVEVTRETLPELSEQEIRMEDSLVDLGANSVDRSEIIVSALDRLTLRIPMIEFSRARNLGEVVGILQAGCR